MKEKNVVKPLFERKYLWTVYATLVKPSILGSEIPHWEGQRLNR